MLKPVNSTRRPAVSGWQVGAASYCLAIAAACTGPTRPLLPTVSASLSTTSTSIGPGDSAVLALVIRNLSRTAVTFDVGAAGSAFDVSIENMTGHEVWRRSAQPHGFPAVTLAIAATDSTILYWTLRVSGAGGVGLPLGRYRLKGYFVDSKSNVIVAASPPLDIEFRLTQ
jgi:hypothetical protein